MISAKESREIVTQGMSNKAVEQMNLIETKIKVAIDKGWFAVNIDGIIEQVNRLKLEDLGYKVSSGNQYNESYFTVSWY